MSEAIKARFLGEPEGSPGHEFLNGVPARNILESEWAELPPEDHARIHHAKFSDGKRMYDVRTDAEMHPARAAEAPESRPADVKPSGKRGGD